MRPRAFYQNQLDDFEQNKVITKRTMKRFLKDPYTFFAELYNTFEQTRDYKTLKNIEYYEALVIEIIADNNKSDLELKCINESKRFFLEKLNESKQRQSTIMLYSVLFQNRNEVSDLFTKKEMELIDSYEYDIRSKSIKIYQDRILNNEYLVPSSQKILFSYLTSLIGSNDQEIDEVCEECFNYLLRNNVKLSLVELEFVANYLTYKDWNYDISTCPKAYVGTRTVDAKALGLSDGSRKDIRISEKYLFHPIMEFYNIKQYKNAGELAEDVKSLPFVIFHEIQHQRQSLEEGTNMLNLTCLYTVFSDILYKYRDKNFQEQKENYAYLETENEANMVGGIKAKEFCKMYYPDQVPVYDMTAKYFRRKFAKSVYNNRFYNKQDTVTYNIERMEEILKEHPEELSYKVLKVGFSSNGSIKNIYDFIDEYSNKLNNGINHSRNDVYDYFFKYYIYNSKRFNFNLSKLEIETDEQKVAYIILLERFISNEIESLKNLFDSMNEYDITITERNSFQEFINLIDNRIDALINAYSVLENCDFRHLIMSSDIKNKRSKLTEINNMFKNIKNCNLTSYVLNNPTIANNDYFITSARRIDHIANDTWSTKGRDVIRKIISSRPKDSINLKER